MTMLLHAPCFPLSLPALPPAAPGNVFFDSQPLLFYFFRKKGVLWINGNVKRLRQGVCEIPERFLDKHRGHSSYAQLQKKDLLLFILFQKFVDLPVFVSILGTFQECISPYQGSIWLRILDSGGSFWRGYTDSRQ